MRPSTKNFIHDVVTRVADFSSVENDHLSHVLDKIKKQYHINYCIRCGIVGQALDLKAVQCKTCRSAWCNFCKKDAKPNRHASPNKDMMEKYDRFIASSHVPCEKSIHDALVLETYPYVFTVKFIEELKKEIKSDFTEFYVGLQHTYRFHQIEVDIKLGLDGDLIDEDIYEFTLSYGVNELIDRYIGPHDRNEILEGYIVKFFEPELLEMFIKRGIRVFCGPPSPFENGMELDLRKNYYQDLTGNVIIIHQSDDT